MHTQTSWRPSAVVALLLLMMATLLSSCANTANKPEVTTPLVDAGQQRAVPTGALTPVDSISTVTYGRSLVSSPVPAGASAAFTRQQALDAASTSLASDLSGSPEIALRLVSFDPAGGATLPAGMTDDLKVSNVLAWVLVYLNTPAVIRGPGTLSAAQRQSIASSEDCEWIVVFNAVTGTGIDNEQLCHRATPSN